MDRLTHERVNGIKTGYWTDAKKDNLVQQLGRYEDTGLTPQEVRQLQKDYACVNLIVSDLRFLIGEAQDAAAGLWPEKQLAQAALELLQYGKEHPWIFAGSAKSNDQTL